MWILLILIALIPLFFFWTDAAVDLIPQWKEDLPLNKDSTQVQEAGGATLTEAQRITQDRKAGKPIPWLMGDSATGYVAYLISPDDQYRVAVGCDKDMPPSLQLTHISGTPVPSELSVETAIGPMAITGGFNQEESLIGMVSHLDNIVVTHNDQKITSFHTSIQASESVAQYLSQNCKR